MLLLNLRVKRELVQCSHLRLIGSAVVDWPSWVELQVWFLEPLLVAAGSDGFATHQENYLITAAGGWRKRNPSGHQSHRVHNGTPID